MDQVIIAHPVKLLEVVFMLPMVEIHAIVKGEVQGVGFRAAVKRYALELDLVGTACNLEDGSVEIAIQGPKDKVDQLFRELKNAFSSEISSIQQQERNFPRAYKGFCILR